MQQRIGREIWLKQYPLEIPQKTIFEIVKADIPEIKEGEFLVQNIWMSVDPYMRGKDESSEETKKLYSII